MDKVYCKDCKHRGFLLCNIMSKSAITNEYTGDTKGFKIKTDNSKGDCPYYEPKLLPRILRWFKGRKGGKDVG